MKIRLKMKTEAEDLIEADYWVGVGTVKNRNKFEGVIKKYGDFEKIIEPNDKDRLVQRYTTFKHFENLITVSSLIGSQKPNFNTNFLINISLSNDLCGSELENYVRKTGIKLREIRDLDKIKVKQLGLEETFKKSFFYEVEIAINLYTLFHQFGPLYTNVYNSLISKTLKNMNKEQK